jgi:hypothetical protein
MIHPRILIYLFTYLLIIAIVVSLIRRFFYKKEDRSQLEKSVGRFFGKKTKETWVQVYDTDSFEEARAIQVRLEEEDLECLIYEQGRKDVHGNPLKGFGIVVPRTSVPRAQNIIARMPA